MDEISELNERLNKAEEERDVILKKGFGGYAEYIIGEKGLLEDDIKELHAKLSSKDEVIRKMREALKHPASIYESWRSTNGNPMMIADPEKCKLAYDVLSKYQGEQR